MKQTLLPKQSTFFKRNGYLLLDGLLKEDACEELSSLIPPLTNQRDFSRTHPPLRSVATRKTFSHLAKELFDTPMLRLAFDHVFTDKPPFLPGTTLQSACSFQSLLGALLLCLSPPDHSSPPFPDTKGGGLFFTAEYPLPWDSLPPATYFLIAYCPLNSLYIHNPSDPLTHSLKTLGYVFGDHLRDPLHPSLK